MTQIDPLSTAFTTQGLTGSLNRSMEQDDFFKLLISQLSHQDPLSPMESQDFAAQLAQFSSLEKLQSIDGKIEEGVNVDLILTQAINNTLAATLIGKGVTAYGNGISLSAGEPTQIHFRLNDYSENVVVKIKDQAGKVVREMSFTALAGGNNEVTWDGEDGSGKPLPTGSYEVEIEATDKAGNPLQATPLMTGIIEAVRYEDGSAMLMVAGQEIYFQDVLEIATTDS